MSVAPEVVIASDNLPLPVDSLPHSYTYSSGLLETDTVVFGGRTYVQTYTYTLGVLTSISAWVLQ